MTTYKAVLTPAGRTKLMAAIASNTPLQLQAIAVGDGNGNPIDPTVNTAIVHEVFRNNISSLTVDPNDSHLIHAEVVIPSSQGGWYVREVGLFDVDNTLILIANFPDTYKPVAADGATRDLVIRVAMKLANTSAVTLNVDTNIVVASRTWVLSTVTASLLFPGGTTGQILKKRSNADGDADWADPENVVPLISGRSYFMGQL